MNFDRGLGFIGGLVMGGLIGATLALLFAPASGDKTRDQIRSEGVALKNRGQEYGSDRVQDAQKMVKQGQKGISDTGARIGIASRDQMDNVKEAMGFGQ